LIHTETVVSNGENFTDSSLSWNSRSTQAAVELGNTDVNPILVKIGDPTALVNVAASIGRYGGAEIDVHFSAQPKYKE
jgi:hypothetical protein